MTKVVNIHREPYDVCIMRPSIYGNPFRIGRDGTREEVIIKFRKCFYKRIEHDEAYLQVVMKLADKKIGCCCSPLPCHGDVYVEFLDSQINDEYFEDILDRRQNENQSKK